MEETQVRSAARIGVSAAVALACWLAAGPAAGTLRHGDPHHCLALALYHEARAEGRAGMEAVASVVLNRVAHSAFPDDVCSVVTEGGTAPPCQFSWWCDGRSLRPGEPRAWQQALAIAADALAAPPRDRTGGALFFHSARIATPWRVERARTVQIGGHVFYR
jgi:N-acetylmuramoyl-L-alanine amidase